MITQASSACSLWTSPDCVSDREINITSSCVMIWPFFNLSIALPAKSVRLVVWEQGHSKFIKGPKVWIHCLINFVWIWELNFWQTSLCAPAQKYVFCELAPMTTDIQRIMYVLLWRAVSTLTRGLFCLFPELQSNEGNRHQIHSSERRNGSSRE